MRIRVGARSSPLSKIQFREVEEELRQHRPEVVFEGMFISTKGDKDKKTSLRTLDKTNFFTEELDNLLLSGEVDVTIHSAKDLPDPIPEGIEIVAITRGVNPSDSLVLREGMTLESLPPGAVIATSSVRREEAVRQLRGDLKFIDLRGTIGERIALIEQGAADGVVIAEAALIRLGLHPNRTTLPGKTTPLQGQLAILAREEDTNMKKLFTPIHAV